MGPVRQLVLLIALLLGACSMRATIDRLSSPEDRAFGQEVVRALRTHDEAWLQRHFDPELWTKSRGQLASVREVFPREAGTTELMGFETSSSWDNGHSESRKRFRFLTHGGGRWVATGFETYSIGGGARIVEWNIVPHDTKPPELAMLEAWERWLPWIRLGIAAAVIGFAVLIFWLVRRSRRKHDPWAGGTGTS